MRSWIALISTVSTVALLGAGAAQAQTDGAASVEAVVVTGTRLQTGFAAPTPVKVIGEDLIASRAPVSIGEITNEIPGFRYVGPTNNTRSTTAAVGTNVPDLRGLGQQRTLVLLNGRRFTPSYITNVVDTNYIPSSLISRLEVVTGGASAAYGSDAVAGVVNFITKDRIDGIEGNIQTGISQYGDNKTYAGSLATGGEFAGGRGRYMIGGEATQARGAGFHYERKWGRREPGVFSFGNVRAANQPFTGYADGVALSNMTSGGLITAGPLKGTAFGPGGTPYQFQYGTVYGTSMVGGDNYGANNFLTYQLSYPFRRHAVMGTVNFDFTDNLSGFIELSTGSLNNRGSWSNVPQTTVIVSRDNPFLPAATRQAMIATNQTTATVGRFNLDIGGWAVNTTTETNRTVAGLKGEVFGGWQWEASITTGHTKMDNSHINMVHLPNYQAAAYAVRDASGNIVCGPLASNPNLTAVTRLQVKSGCVPFNIFGPGAGSQAAYDYVTPRQAFLARNTQDVAAFSIAGEPFALPAGPVALAMGVEYRKESVYLGGVKESDGGLNPFQFGNNQSFDGSTTVKEAFAEVGVPILKDMPLARALDVNGAIRRTDYKTSGAVTTWKFGFTYEPNETFRVRATQSRDIRAPSLNDLYSVGGIGTGGAGTVNPFTGRVGTITSQTLGNPNLVPEVADTLTAGIVFQPTWTWAQGFRASLDMYRITMHGVIGAVGGAETLDRCFAGDKNFCAAITFANAAGDVSFVRAQTYNINKLATNGVDLDVQYRVPLENLPGALPGRLDLRVLHTWIDDLTTTDTNGPTDRAGAAQAGMPSITGTVTFDYSLGRFGANLQARYLNEMKYDALLKGPDDPNFDPRLTTSVSKNRWPAVVYYNLQARYDLIDTDDRQLQIFGVINNLLNKDPAFAASVAFNNNGATNPYDLIGRSFRAGVRFGF